MTAEGAGFSRTFVEVSRYREGAPIPGEIWLWWLGQAGFLLRSRHRICLIDTYLSDYLSLKYRGSKFPHKRMMEPPIQYSQLQNIDFFFSTHPHSDHLDPEGLDVLADLNPECLFVIPGSAVGKAVERGVPENRIAAVEDGDCIELSESLELEVIPSAHESLQYDAEDRSLFLGYILAMDGLKIYHSGDCVPYGDLPDRIRAMGIGAALLPVNGRDAYRSGHGIPGNFRYDEARDLVADAGIPYMIAHHFGMFDFNTVDPEQLRGMIRSDGLNDRIHPAEINVRYTLSAGPKKT